MRGIFSVLSDFAFNVREDLKEFGNKHFDFFHEGWTPRGLYLRLPFTRLSAFIEWREVNVGFGHERTGHRDWTFYFGKLQGAFCIEPRCLVPAFDGLGRE